MMKIELNIHSEIKGLRFDKYGEDNLTVAIGWGDATVNGVVWKFELILQPTVDGEWQSVRLNWADITRPPILGEKQFIQELVNCAARLLCTINMWPGEQTEGGASLTLNQKVIPEDVRNRVLVSFRPDILKVPSVKWDLLWEYIEQRVEADPLFEVLGFERETLQRILPLLKQIFPNDWVRARYKSAGNSGMADQFEAGSEGWFPAYHLARTAHGAICRDPGWNYLVEIGLALEVLREFEGLDRLKRQLTKSSGTQHHVCLPADLHERGLLRGLEPQTGIGAATNDLLVGTGENIFQIEVKEFTSENPARQLQREIADKVNKLPQKPRQPVVFHVVRNEQGLSEKAHEDSFLDAIKEVQGALPDKISAVVAGKRFVDSTGGRIKRSIDLIVTNPTAISPIEKEYLRVVFEANYHDIKYPIYGIGTFFSFGIN
ncbi:MAG: hypothetical protein R3B95_21360 [Nitrospirales bacterium]|nr:hypothetical protein [Nitrospirales bacterium]